MSTVIPINIEQELKSSYLSYAMSVIINRAIPDVRDGLKPVHRRILHSMNELGFYWNKPYRKSARVIGEVIGKYHPHGDSAIYDALVRMAQDFSLLVPLIDGQGNFGSIDGDPAAAMRYTEVRLEYISKFLLDDLYENSVDFRPNYDTSENEPVVLPAKFPNILVNGTAGVAVGMATNVPTHNLAEVIDACKLFLENKDVQTDELLKVIKGPDFPTGGFIIGEEGIRSAFETGRGSIIIRSRTHFEETDTRKVIIVDELPYQVNKAKLIENIALLVKEKRLDSISDLRDESNKDGIRIVIELKRGFSCEVVLNQLFQMTQLQTSYSTNMMLLHKMKPTLMPLKDVLAAFIDHRREVISRRTEFRLAKARERASVLIAVYVAILNIDEIVPILKSSKDNETAVLSLCSKKWNIDEDLKKLVEIISNIQLENSEYELSRSQSKAILEMKMQRITGVEKEQLVREIHSEIEVINECISILGSDAVLVNVIVQELNEIREKYPHPRKSVILKNTSAIHTEEELIERETVVVTVTYSGYIKRVSISNYRVQKRGGKGKIAQNIKPEDQLAQIFVLSTHDEILFFSNRGKVYKIKAYKLPVGDPQARGRALVNIFELSEGESITSILPLRSSEDENLIFLTAQGKIKRNSMSDFNYVPTNGKVAIKLNEDDRLIAVKTSKNEDCIFISTRDGKCIRFLVDDLRVLKSRSSEGVKALTLSNGDEAISLSILNQKILSPEEKALYMRTKFSERIKDPTNKDEQFVLSVTENGYGKITSSYEYRITNRGGVGIINIATSKRNGKVVSSFRVLLDNHIMLITNRGQVIRIAASNIPVLGRSTQGVRLFTVKDDERVASVTEVGEVEENDPVQDDYEVDPEE
ncbi:DNA gyrase, A subunit [Neorickettsia helminthoeca str. Oregon]|uniref:DNA gyrase subunit A n=1 Tax=Neorickettsia helminthoeca str. Oregon TaxID=1286528 RepID=X5H566_9RICK|nr:DNA gyrase subunit A [Neorickettsia helminthoeca]AHX11833.1 DNA gyrase, A subunit [Neorickettsia helminthoeca str. Oregon]